MLKFAVFVSGGGTNLQSLIDATQSGSINGEIVLVVSNRKKAYGLERAKNAGIQAEQCNDKALNHRRIPLQSDDDPIGAKAKQPHA